LRSALDILYSDVVRFTEEGEVTNWTRFPITETRGELVPYLTGALKKKTNFPNRRGLHHRYNKTLQDWELRHLVRSRNEHYGQASTADSSFSNDGFPRYSP